MTNNKTGLKKLIKPLLQLVVTALALYLVLKKTDTAKLAGFIRGANLWYLLLALVFFNISKIFNAIRLNRFFKAIGIELSPIYNLKLYYLGMFYNLFLPGGIGGDGYKIYILQKNHDLKMINVFHAVLWDRICGIFALVFLSIILLLPSSFALKFPHLTLYSWALLAAVYPCAFLLNKLLYKQFIGVFTITAIESMLVQVTQVISVFFILKAMSQHANMIDYLAIFLISTIATIIQLETSTGVALSLIFFAISALSSLTGILTRISHEKKVPDQYTLP